MKTHIKEIVREQLTSTPIPPTFCAIHPRLINIKVLLHTIDKDVGNIQPKVKKLADDGFIKFEDGAKNSKIPYLTYDEIKLEI